MEIKSHPKQSTCKRFIRALENGNPTAIIGLVAGITLIVTAMIQIPMLVDDYNEYSKYSEIVETKPILRCGHLDDPILPTNYQAFRVDDKKLIRVYYSADSFRDYTSPECKVLNYDTNAQLETDRIHQTIGQLKKEKTELEIRLKSKDIEIENLNNNITKIRDDYKLPTFEELNEHYESFKKTKKPDFDLWIEKQKEKEIVVLAKARVEANPKTVSCYSKVEEYPELYDIWLSEGCNELEIAIQKFKKETKMEIE